MGATLAIPKKEMQRIMKRQRYKEGAIVKIKLTDGRIGIGRLLPGVAAMICVYDFIAKDESELVAIDQVVAGPVLFWCGLYRTVITKGIFEIIGHKELSAAEVASVPPSFTQDMVNVDDCVIWWIGGGERAVSPSECIGLERSSVWDENGIIQRMEDHYAGRKNAHVELDKVILSKEDPRYLPPPGLLRWDFEKQLFYRIDKLTEQ